MLCYVNGAFLEEDEAKISAFDLGLLRGFGVFEVLRTYHGEPFHLWDHLVRLKNSADQVGLLLPNSIEEIADIVEETLKKNTFKNILIRIVVTAGESFDGMHSTKRPSLLVLLQKILPLKKEIKLISLPITRFMPTSKSLNYLPAIVSLQKARDKEADDALYLSEKGEILESTTSNFFAFKGNTLLTPSEGILEGITRKIVLEIAKAHYLIEVKPLFYNMLHEFDEVFLTSSIKEIMPIYQIDKIPFKIGEKTSHLQKLFFEKTSSKYMSLNC